MHPPGKDETTAQESFRAHRFIPNLFWRMRVWHLAIVGAICLSIALSALAQGASPSRIETRMEGSVLIIDGWLETSVDRALAWAVLTDYESFPRFVPGIRVNRVLRREGALRWIEQQGETLAMGLRMPYAGMMRVEEMPRQRIAILFLSGPFRDVRGEWQLHESQPLRLTYRMHLDLAHSPHPPNLAKAMAEQQVRLWVEVFAAEMARRQREGAP